MEALDLKALTTQVAELELQYLPAGKKITPRIILYWGANQLLPNSGVRGRAVQYQQIDAFRCILVRRMQAEIGLKIEQIKVALNSLSDADVKRIVEQQEALDVRLGAQDSSPQHIDNERIISLSPVLSRSPPVVLASTSIPAFEGPDDSPAALRSLSDSKKESLITEVLETRMKCRVRVALRGLRYDGVIGNRGPFNHPAQLSFDLERPLPEGVQVSGTSLQLVEGSYVDTQDWLRAIKVMSDDELAKRVAAALGRKVGTPLRATVSDRSYWRNKVRFVVLLARVLSFS